jgi:LCP family protein required for cell wall assembly
MENDSWKGLVMFMKNTKHKRMNKILKIILISVTGLIILISLSVYLLLHHYINKINLVSPDTTDKEAVTQEISGTNAADITDAAGNSRPSTVEAEGSSIDKEVASIPLPQEASSASGNIAENSTVEGSAAVRNEETDIVLDNPAKSTGKNSSDKEIPASGSNLRSEEDVVDTEDSVELMEDKEVLNILLIGSNTKSVTESGKSDSIVLLTLNKKKQKIITTSFLRDSYLTVPGNGNKRLKEVFTIGGADLLLDTLEQNYRIKIDKYIMADFYTFIDIVDSIGGITVDISDEELDKLNKNIKEINEILEVDSDLDLLQEGGTVLLNGKQALGYSRNRYSENNDADRQKEVILTIYERIKQLNFIQMNGFLNTILPQITTNFKENEIFAQLFIISGYFDYGLEQWSVPMKGTYTNKRVSGKQVLQVDFDKNITEIYKRLYNKE